MIDHMVVAVVIGMDQHMDMAPHMDVRWFPPTTMVRIITVHHTEDRTGLPWEAGYGVVIGEDLRLSIFVVARIWESQLAAVRRQGLYLGRVTTMIPRIQL